MNIFQFCLIGKTITTISCKAKLISWKNIDRKRMWSSYDLLKQHFTFESSKEFRWQVGFLVRWKWLTWKKKEWDNIGHTNSNYYKN